MNLEYMHVYRDGYLWVVVETGLEEALAYASGAEWAQLAHGREDHTGGTGVPEDNAEDIDAERFCKEEER